KQPSTISGAAAGATGTRPFKAATIKAASPAERESSPTLSRVGASGTAPEVDQKPTVVLKPKMPHRAAGTRTEPPVSLPSAKAHSPAATATAEPLLDPPGRRGTCRSQGLTGVPRTAFTP